MTVVVIILAILLVPYTLVLLAIREESRKDVRKATNRVLAYKNAQTSLEKKNLEAASKALLSAQEDLRLTWIWPIVIVSGIIDSYRREKEETREATRIARLGE